MRSRASYRSPPATRIRSALPLLRLVVHQRPSLNSRWSTASYNLAQCPLWVKSGQTASRAKIRLGPLLSKSGQTRVRLKGLQSAINDHRSMSEGSSATAPPGVRPTLETAECGGQPRRSSIVVCRFGHSAALGGDGGFSPHYSVHSRIARQQRRHSAILRSCLDRRPTDLCASRVDRQAGRRRNNTPAPNGALARGTEPVAFGMLLAAQLYDFG